MASNSTEQGPWSSFPVRDPAVFFMRRKNASKSIYYSISNRMKVILEKPPRAVYSVLLHTKAHYVCGVCLPLEVLCSGQEFAEPTPGRRQNNTVPQCLLRGSISPVVTPLPGTTCRDFSPDKLERTLLPSADRMNQK